MSTDRIEKKILLRSPLARVWRALSDSKEFGDWFGFRFEIWIEEVVPNQRLSLRWHPFAVERDVDYSGEPTTLASFDLEEVNDGVMLTVTESGFDRIPLERRAKAFTANEPGWRARERLAADAEAPRRGASRPRPDLQAVGRSARPASGLRRDVNALVKARPVGYCRGVKAPLKRCPTYATTEAVRYVRYTEGPC